MASNNQWVCKVKCTDSTTKQWWVEEMVFPDYMWGLLISGYSCIHSRGRMGSIRLIHVDTTDQIITIELEMQ